MIPTNASTGKQYNGGNLIKLMSTDYKSQIWATYRQWQKLGKQVKKGEKGMKLFKIVTVDNFRSGKKVTKEVPRGFTVFNVEQVKEIQEEAA